MYWYIMFDYTSVRINSVTSQVDVHLYINQGVFDALFQLNYITHITVKYTGIFIYLIH
mgnify:CR=1 FL=1